MPMLPTRSRLPMLREPGQFWWATGIEDTFITAPHPRTGRQLDEYELTGHYDRWRQDLDLMASLKVQAARYGVPWHKIQPQPGRWDWRHADEPLEYMLSLGIAPQVDLVHYGLPGWLDGAYLNPDYPARVAEFAGELASRFRGRIHWYTPLNEPRITAWYCGRLGWWPPFERSWRGFVKVMLAVAAGIQATVRALRSVDPEIVAYHVDATDLYVTDEPLFTQQARHRQDIVHLALDLVAGRVGPEHSLHHWLAGLGAQAGLERLRDQPSPPDVIGLNLYPLFSRKRLVPGGNGRMRIRMSYTQHGLIEPIARGYHDRYGCPLMISEAATSGSIARRLRWLAASVEALRTLRAEGVPVTGYTWWPMFALVTWAWRQGRRPVEDHLLQMGLWDLDRNLNRIATPLVDAYRALAMQGETPVGRLAAR